MPRKRTRRVSQPTTPPARSARRDELDRMIDDIEAGPRATARGAQEVLRRRAARRARERPAA